MKWATANQDRVLLFLPWQFDLLGGVDVVVDRLWRGLERERPGATLIGLQGWRRSRLEEDAAGRKFLQLNLPPPPQRILPNGFRYLATLARWLPQLRTTLLEHRIRTVNFHFPTLSVFPLALLRRLGLWRGHIILSFHGSDVRAIERNSNAWRLIAEQTDAVVACSRSLAAEIGNLRLFEGKPINVVYNGIDAVEFFSTSSATSNSLDLPSRYILNIGAYVSGKGQDVLLEAFSRIAKSHPEMHLVLVGASQNNCPWLSILEQTACELGLSTRVHFYRDLTQTQVAEVIQRALCMAHSSHREGFPLVLIEAGAHGLPIVATAVGGIPELISSNDLGWMVPPNDVTQLAAALTTLLDDPTHAQSLGENLRRHVRDSFSAAKMVERYARIILWPSNGKFTESSLSGGAVGDNSDDRSSKEEHSGTDGRSTAGLRH